MGLQQALSSGKFAVTVEVGPLKGTDTSHFVDSVNVLKDRIDAANVTDLQSSVMRVGSLAMCHLLNESGIDPIYQLTCRDRNRLAIQSDLLSASVLGVQNVLVLTGDFPSLGDHPHAKPVFDLDSVQLLWVIQRLQEGYDISGNELIGKPRFFPGAVVNPGYTSPAQMELQLIKMEKKTELGAKFFQTQAVFDVGSFERFMEKADRFRVPIIAGVIMLKSAKMAQYMNEHVAGISVPQPLIQRMAEARMAEDRVKVSIEIAVDLIERLKQIVQGVHIMALGWEKYVPTLLDAIGEKMRIKTKKVLVLDAGFDLQDTVKRICAGRYEIEVGQSRVEGLELVEKEPPDLIVLGALGTRNEGAILCTQLKHDPKYGGIPILVVDAPPDQHSFRGWKRAEGLTLEADDYVSRPLPDAQLLAHIEELIK